MSLAYCTGMRSTSSSRHDRESGDRGSTLIEAAIGLGLIAVLLVTVASLLVIARRVTAGDREQTLALALARTRLEQLQSLGFARERLAGGGVAEITDLETDLSGPEANVGGPGLADSPGDALVRPAHGYADCLDAEGRWMDCGEAEGARPAFVRRWRIERVGRGAGELALIDVLVAPAAAASRLATASAPIDMWLKNPDVVRLSAVRARRAR
jgi:type II secretory pathway pseudopilin PulG